MLYRRSGRLCVSDCLTSSLDLNSMTTEEGDEVAPKTYYTMLRRFRHYLRGCSKGHYAIDWLDEKPEAYREAKIDDQAPKTWDEIGNNPTLRALTGTVRKATLGHVSKTGQNL